MNALSASTWENFNSNSLCKDLDKSSKSDKQSEGHLKVKNSIHISPISFLVGFEQWKNSRQSPSSTDYLDDIYIVKIHYFVWDYEIQGGFKLFYFGIAVFRSSSLLL